MIVRWIERCHDCIYYGLSSDEKPTECNIWGAFIETDTDNVYIWSDGWRLVGSSSSILLRENEILNKASQLISEYSSRNNSMGVSFGHSASTCIACDAQLDAITRGRHKFCAKCGVYLPRIIYDKSA